MTLEETIVGYQRKAYRCRQEHEIDIFADARASEYQQIADWLKELKALKEKPLRRIDTMSEEKLAIAVNGFKASLDGCQFCPVETCHDANGECSVKFAHYLLSPIEKEEKTCNNCKNESACGITHPVDGEACCNWEEEDESKTAHLG